MHPSPNTTPLIHMHTYSLNYPHAPISIHHNHAVHPLYISAIPHALIVIPTFNQHALPSISSLHLQKIHFLCTCIHHHHSSFNSHAKHLHPHAHSNKHNTKPCKTLSFHFTFIFSNHFKPASTNSTCISNPHAPLIIQPCSLIGAYSCDLNGLFSCIYVMFL